MRKKAIANSSKVSVTFEMPAEIEGQTLCLVGDFNDWNPEAMPMKRRQDGTWAVTVRLAPGSYRFRYFADGTVWLNDPAADGFEPSGLGEDNSVLNV